MATRLPDTHPLSRSLVEAAFLCDFVRVRELLGQGAHPDARDGDGRTPIFSAVLGGSVGVLGLLLESGADVNAQDSEGWTALHFAAQENLAEMARLLIGRGADVNRRDSDGVTPLWRAVQSSAGHPDLTSILTEAGAKDDIANAAGETPRQLSDRLGFALFDLN